MSIKTQQAVLEGMAVLVKTLAADRAAAEQLCIEIHEGDVHRLLMSGCSSGASVSRASYSTVVVVAAG